MTSKVTTAVLGTMLLFPSIVLAEEAPETLLVQRLLKLSEFREAMISAAGRSVEVTQQAAGPVPTGTGIEISTALFRSDERIWKALEAELPRWLAEQIPRERLEALARAYGENPGHEVGQSGPELLALVWKLAERDSQLRKEIARSSCSAGFLAPNIDEARKKKGTSDTPFKAPPDFFEKIQPFLQPIDETCGCLVRLAPETAGEEFFSDQMPKEERGALMLQLIQTGKCPDPFADYR